MHACMHTLAHTCTCACTYACKNTHACTHTQPPVQVLQEMKVIIMALNLELKVTSYIKKEVAEVMARHKDNTGRAPLKNGTILFNNSISKAKTCADVITLT